MKKLKIYIASPYSIGDKEQNVMRQIEAMSELMDHGLIPFAPLLAHYVDIVHPKPYTIWLQYCMRWVMTCDILLRLPGESEGADMEEVTALVNNMPVFYSIEELLEHLK
jgi:hypothetical protein